MQSYKQSIHELFTKKTARRCKSVLWKFAKFIGPGTIISVAYVDPDNYQTAVSAGTEFKFKLLFMILVSNLIAIYLQVSTFSKTRSSGNHNQGTDADKITGTGGQAGRGHRYGTSAIEPRLPSTLVKHRPLHYGRGSDCLHRYFTSKFQRSRSAVKTKYLTHVSTTN